MNKIKNIMKKANIPGLSLSILQNDKVEIINLGISDNNTQKEISNKTIWVSASLGKPVFAYGVLKLVEEKKLDLDKPLFKYLPENKIDKTLKKDKRYKKITTRMVLTHTSGLQNDGSNKILFNPGEKFTYSGDAFLYLQHVIENITNLHINDFMTEKVFIPFKMYNSSYVYKTKYNKYLITPHDYNCNVKYWGKNMKMDIKNTKSRGHVDGGLFTTIEDYSNFLIGLSKDISIQTMMTKKQIKLNNNIYWGLGIGVEIIENQKMIWHWGDNLYMRHFMIFDPKNGTGFVLLTNSYNGLSIIDSISKLLYNKKFKSVLALKELTEGRYLHEQYDNPLRINRLLVMDEFLNNGQEKGMKKYKKWVKNLKDKDQINVLTEGFNTWLYKKNIKYVNAINNYSNINLLCTPSLLWSVWLPPEIE